MEIHVEKVTGSFVEIFFVSHRRWHVDGPATKMKNEKWDDERFSQLSHRLGWVFLLLCLGCFVVAWKSLEMFSFRNNFLPEKCRANMSEMWKFAMRKRRDDVRGQYLFFMATTSIWNIAGYSVKSDSSIWILVCVAGKMLKIEMKAGKCSHENCRWLTTCSFRFEPLLFPLPVNGERVDVLTSISDAVNSLNLKKPTNWRPHLSTAFWLTNAHQKPSIRIDGGWVLAWTAHGLWCSPLSQ